MLLLSLLLLWHPHSKQHASGPSVRTFSGHRLEERSRRRLRARERVRSFEIWLFQFSSLSLSLSHPHHHHHHWKQAHNNSSNSMVSREGGSRQRGISPDLETTFWGMTQMRMGFSGSGRELFYLVDPGPRIILNLTNSYDCVPSSLSRCPRAGLMCVCERVRSSASICVFSLSRVCLFSSLFAQCHASLSCTV